MTTVAHLRSSSRSGDLWGRPSVVSCLVFFLLFSGPPRLRERDPSASLRSEFDAVVILHVVVWAVAGIWVLYHMRFYFQAHFKSIGLRLPQKLGLGLVAVLGVSTLVSVAPALTAFKVYQMLVLLMFTAIFVRRYGVGACLRKLFQATAALCVVIAISTAAFPDLVMVTTETGARRLRGDFIAPTEFVALFCLVLLLSGVQRISKVTYTFLLCLSCALLLFSLSRTAYLVLFVLFILVVFKRPTSKHFRRFAYAFGIVGVLSLVLGLASAVNQYRDPESLSNLSDRWGLWTYLSNVTLQKSPWVGLGYYAASRVYGPRYNEALGGAHSIFFETFVGGGILAVAILVVLCGVMSVYAIQASRQSTELPFTLVVLFLASMMFGCVGGTLDSGPEASMFWCLAAILPVIHKSNLAITGKQEVTG